MSKAVKLTFKLDKVLVSAVTKAGGRKGTHMALDHLASVSKDQVPLDQGPLKNSCYVDVNADGSAGTVSYDTPYAIRQHENLRYKHQRGRKAKYLEDPVYNKTVQSEMLTLAGRGMASEIE
jgi:hypothetical protein